ncbi:uncharacterized protein IL334_006360 [Kwoniella shivajii]|uniref:Uncharacterized protein n=1 Tax=Kwoniella shivajii TaxID=564305 RepID=A0ABZ1D6B4_9TREE|nr:hypothetical protein IL334_006360 [Kwoniella shivajii]
MSYGYWSFTTAPTEETTSSGTTTEGSWNYWQQTTTTTCASGNSYTTQHSTEDPTPEPTMSRTMYWALQTPAEEEEEPTPPSRIHYQYTAPICYSGPPPATIVIQATEKTSKVIANVKSFLTPTPKTQFKSACCGARRPKDQILDHCGKCGKITPWVW